MALVTPAAPVSFSDIEHLYCGSVYPGDMLGGCETALCLFSAAWHGRQDVYWLAKAGLTGTCVDLDGGRLAEMEAVYPDGWEFVQADVYEWLTEAPAKAWDVVTLDPWTGQFERCADLLGVWCSLARKVVILGHGNYRLREPEAPAGWKLTRKIRRSDFKGGINWLVFTRA